MKPLYWLLLMLAVVSIPILAHLDELPIQLWDESRLAVSAFEMTKTGNLWVTTYENQPDMWNLKPPINIWLIAASIKIFGNNEFAVRLPSALFAILTCILLFKFLYNNTSSAITAFFACFVLITCEGYVRIHGIRTADYEAMLTFSTTAYLLNYYLFIKRNEGKYLLYFFIFLTLAVFTKSIAGMMFLPGLLIYTLLQKKLLAVFKTKYFYLGTIFFLLTIVSYYLYREAATPGYLQAVWDNELLGRYNTVIENHDDPPNFYLHGITTVKYKYWIVITILSLALIVHKDNIHKLLLKFSLLSSMLFLLIISFADTKLDWYDMPVYPLLAIIAAIGLAYFIENLSLNKLQKKSKAIVITILISALLVPYADIVAKSFTPKHNPYWDENHYMCFFMARAIRGEENINNLIFTDDSLEQNVFFYFSTQKDEKNLRYKGMNSLDSGDKVIMFKSDKIGNVYDMYRTNTVDSFANVKVFIINGKK